MEMRSDEIRKKDILLLMQGNNMKQLIKITSVYGEEFIRVLIKKTKEGIYTDKGFVPFCDIEYIDVIGDVKE